MARKIYNSKEVSVVISGTTITGFAKSIVKIEPVEKELVKTDAGAQGDYVHSLNHDGRHKITITLWQNSPSCAFLHGLAMTGNDFPILIKNTSDGAYLGAGESCVVNERTTKEFSSEIKEIPWVLTVADYKDSFL